MSIRYRLVATLVLGLFAPCSLGQIGEMEFYNGFDPEKPTIIAAHGWFGSIDYNSTFGRSPSFDERANVIGWEWDAVVFFGITAKARRSGRELAQEFSDFLLTNHPDYEQPIQIVGHSLGTHVVLAAAAELRDIGRNDPNYLVYQADHVTLVDTGFNEEIPEAIDEIINDYLVPLQFDNYWSPTSAGGTGDYYPGDFPNVRVPLQHVTLWYWYFTSLDSQPPGPLKPGATYSVAGQFANQNFGEAVLIQTEGQNTPLDLTDDRFRRIL